MNVDEVGRFRYCPACARPVMPEDLITGAAPDDIADREEVRCSCCERPWTACPCSPANNGVSNDCLAERCMDEGKI